MKKLKCVARLSTNSKLLIVSSRQWELQPDVSGKYTLAS